MSVSLNTTRLGWAALGAAGVIGGVVVKNTTEKMGDHHSMQARLVGPGLFIGGWLVFLYSVIMNGALGLDNRSIQAGLAVALIVGSVLWMKREKQMGREANQWIKLAFPLGWLLLALTVGVGSITDLSGPDALVAPRSVLAFAAAAMVIGSMGWSLPRQRKHCHVDGPGMPLFVAAWAIMVGLVASRPGA